MLTRAAASSIASGMPSKCRQIPATVDAFWSVSVKRWSTARARSLKSTIAPNESASAALSRRAASGVGTLSDGKRYVYSPAVRSGSRLVARIANLGQPANSAPATIAASVMTCSQLSRISKSALFLRYAISVSSSGRSGTSCTPSVDAIAATTKAGSPTGASATKQTAVSPVSLSAVPTCNAVWVFPMPPAPVSVTSRCSRTSRATSSSSTSRPTKLVRESGKFETPVSGQGPSGNAPPPRRRRDPECVAAASNSPRCSSLSASAFTKSASVSRCGVRRYPRSSAPMPFVLIRARSASASCESPAASR